MESVGNSDDQNTPLHNKAIITPEEEHPIRPVDIEREALKVLFRLRDAGFSGYLVGGGVRDLYLGKRPRDFDISTNAHPGQLRKLFRNSRTIGRRFRLVQVFYRGNKIIEVSTLRSHSEYDSCDGKVLPANNTFGTLEEDAFRRDLTINGLFFEIETNSIIDFVGGVDDLNNGIVRMIGDPEVRITRDPVRMLRAVRHASRTGFSIDERTWEAIVAQRDKLNLCPAARIRDELLKDLASAYSRPWVEKCIKSKIFYTLFPFYESLLTDKDEREKLYSMLTVVDRLQSHNNENNENGIPVQLSEYMLFSALLYPWIEKELNLVKRELGKGGYRILLTELRAIFDDVVCSRFNIKRAAKDAMVTLFVNYPNFMRCQQDNNYPNHLKKKSYFQDCLKFSAIVEEAEGGKTADSSLFVSLKKESQPVLQVYANSGGKGRRNGNPAFTSAKGGVFGLL
jgi:poly(A) polymerase